jgi:hypothetical protein
MAQELARHSDIRLTMNVYTHAGLYDLAGSMMVSESKLPGLDSNQDKENQNLLCYRYTTG